MSASAGKRHHSGAQEAPAVAVASGLRPTSNDALLGRALGGRLIIMERVGKGTFGTVYRAQHMHLAKIVAVKVLNPSVAQDSTVRARFHAEGRAASLLDHPNLVRVLDFGEEHDGTLWLAMEMLEGIELSRALEAVRRLRVEHATELMLQVTAGLAHAHTHRIIHSDVKPSNVILVRRIDDDGRDREQVKLCDFGVVRAMTEGSATTSLGTPHYMSPEQCLGAALDERSDVYGCGAMFYELLTGEPPFVADEPQALLRQHLLVPAPRPSERWPDVDPRVDGVVMKALAKDPENRFANMRELRAALRGLLDELGAPVPVSQRASVPPPPVVARPEQRATTQKLPAQPAAERVPSSPTPRTTPATSEIRALRAEADPAPGRYASSSPRSFTPSPKSRRDAEAQVAVAHFLAARGAVDPERTALASLLERGDVDEIAARVMRLMSRVDSASVRALTLLDDPSQLAPLAEALLADYVLPTPYIERMLSRAGLAAARALWAARIRRPATDPRRMRFVSWLRVIGRPAEDLLRAALAQVSQLAPTPGQVECAEDLLLAVPRPADRRFALAVLPFLESPSPRLRELASSVARPG